MPHDQDEPSTSPHPRLAGGVTRLKELLFDNESQRLEQVQRRIEALDDRETERHLSLGRKVDAVFDRAGSEERLLKSVASIIDGALREAEVSKHDQLSRAMAPLVVKTIKYELKHSQAEMVDALYPITGQLVKQYVQSAIASMMDDINRRLGGGRVTNIEARAKARGLTVAELVLAEQQALKVDELFLVKRGSGELVAHWEAGQANAGSDAHAAQGHNRDVLIAGYLSGITAFSEEAFDEKQGSLRSIDLNGERVFVRASPAYLLAARCSGSAPAAVEQVIDEEFLRGLSTYREILQDADAAGAGSTRDKRDALLPDLAAAFDRRFAEKRSELESVASAGSGKRGRITRLHVFAALILLPLFAWFGWTAFQSYQTNRTRMAALEVLGTVPALAGYPVQIDVAPGGRSLSVSGLAPNAEARDSLTRRLEQGVAWAETRNGLTVLPAAQAARDFTPEIGAVRRDLSEVAVSPVRRALERASARLAELRRAVPTLAPAAGDPRVRDIDEALSAADAAAARLRAAVPPSGDARGLLTELSSLDTRLLQAEASLHALGGSGATRPPRSARPADPAVLAEEIALTTERMATLLPLIERTRPIGPLQQDVSDLRRQLETTRPLPQDLADLRRRVDAIRIPAGTTPRQALVEFARDHAVFFGNGVELLDAADAGLMLQRLAGLANEAGASLRIVGYTDERVGTAVTNSTLALARAERVAQLLVDRGVPRERITALGRATGPEIARTTGPGTPNRRVEFEVAFIGEPFGR